MDHTMCIFVFFNLLTGSTMFPLTSFSPTLSVYDICAQADLNQIEELKESLFVDFSRSSIVLDENASVPFGLLDDDWIRLQELENRIPEGSVLKSKVLIAFRILIAALYQAHGITFEQDDNFLGNEQRNSIEYEDEHSSSDSEFGESNNDYVVIHQPELNTWTTIPDSYDEHLEEFQQLNYTSSKDYPVLSEIPSTTPQTGEYQNHPNSSYDSIQTGLTSNNNITKSIDEIKEKKDDAIFSYTNEETMSIPKPNLDYTVSQKSGTTTEEFSDDIKKEENKNEDDNKLDDKTNNFTNMIDHVKVEVNDRMTERTSFQRLHSDISSEHFYAAHDTTSRFNPTLISVSLGDYTTTPNVPPISEQESITTIFTLEDLTASSVYPELEQLVLINERINNKNHSKPVSYNDLENTLIVLAPTTESWENGHIHDHLDGSDSFINEVTVSKTTTENEVKATSDSDLVQEYTKAVIKKADQLTDSSNISDIFDFSKNNIYVSNEQITINPYVIVNRLKNQISIEKETFINNNGTNSTDEIRTPESSDYISSEEDENFKSGSMERIILNSTNSNGSNPNEDNILESSENMLSVESNNSNGSEERGVVSLANRTMTNPTKHTILDSLKNSLTTENINIQSSSIERDMFTPTSNNGENLTKYSIYENTENVFSAENNDFQGNTEEDHVLSPTRNDNEYSAVKFVLKSTEKIEIENSENTPNYSAETSVFAQKSNDDKSRAVESSKENSLYVSSLENQNVQSSIERKEYFISKHNGEADIDAHQVPKSSEYISSAENNSVQSGVEGKDISRNYENVRSTAKFTAESTEHMTSVESLNLQTSIEAGNVSSSKNDVSVLPTEKYILELSDHISSKKFKNFPSTSVEQIVIRPYNNGDGVIPAIEPIPESSELKSSVENINIATNSKGMGAFSNDDRSQWTPYPGLSRLDESNVHTVDDSEKAYNNEKIEFRQDTTNLPPEVDDATTMSKQTEESYRTINLIYSQSPGISLPTQPYSAVNMYPAYKYPYRPLNFISGTRCHNGNECVHVKHIEYKSYDNPTSLGPDGYEDSR